MLETAHSLYVEGKQRGQVYGFALACIELAKTFRAPATAARLWTASGFTVSQAIAAGLAGADVMALRQLATANDDAPMSWALPPNAKR